MSDAYRKNLIGKQVTFTVVRAGLRVERAGTITRVTPTTVWVGAFCYLHGDVLNLCEVQEETHG